MSACSLRRETNPLMYPEVPCPLLPLHHLSRHFPMFVMILVDRSSSFTELEMNTFCESLIGAGVLHLRQQMSFQGNGEETWVLHRNRNTVARCPECNQYEIHGCN